jgi:hypothetical protein
MGPGSGQVGGIAVIRSQSPDCRPLVGTAGSATVKLAYDCDYRNSQACCPGTYKGRKPYGTPEGEQAIIERMRELRQAGLGFGRIAAALNREGAETSSG